MPFWLLTGLNWGILGSEQDNNTKLLHGSVMVAFMRVEHGFKVVSLFVSKIMVKKAILTAHRAQFEHFGILTR